MLSLLDQCKSNRTREKLANLLFKDLVEIEKLQNMLEVSYAATGMPSGIIDAINGEVHAGAGWQKICINFHRAHPETNARCIANDTAITDKIKNGTHYGYKCSNGIWDIGVPIMCMGKHIATFFLGQFFYEDEVPDISFFIKQADEFGFPKDEYLATLKEVPRFSKSRVDEILKYNIALAAFLSDLASKSMERHFEIEHRKQAESELRSLRNYLTNIIDSMPSALIGVDPIGKITQWNRGAEEISGLTSDEALGIPVAKAIPKLAPEIERIKQAIQSNQQQTYSSVTENDSTKKYEDVTIYPLVSSKTQGAVIRIDDVTKRVNLERMMLQTEKMMSIGGLAAGMAHEINNPLAGILGHTNNIKKRLYSDISANTAAADSLNVSLHDVRSYLDKREIPRMLDGIGNAGTRAANIVSNMLSFARKSENNFSPQNLNNLIDNTIDLAASDYNLKKRYDFRKIEIHRDFDPAPPLVYCEGNEIQQVLLNIFKNGAEAMSEKDYMDFPPHFICKTYTQKDMAVVEIEDNGEGIVDKIRQRIFEPFYTTKEVGKGTGLGLSVSYFIVTDLHGGQMDVESEPGSWTKFIIKLPIKRSI